jgi:Holliday junction resolvase-like predicted endonuclease
LNNWLTRVLGRPEKQLLPIHLRHGLIGERAAKNHLKKSGFKYLAANYRSARGEIDLIFREDDCLLFVSIIQSSVR